MSFEKYSQFYYEPNDGAILRPMGKGKSFSFLATPIDEKRYKLFFTGESGLFYQWKNEPDHPSVYKSIVDSLSSKEAEKSAFALSFSSKQPEDFIRRVYKKIIWQPRLSYLDLVPVPEEWEVGFFVKAKGLKINADLGGYLRMRVDVRYVKEGVSIHSNLNPPDCVHIIDVPNGDYAYQKLSKKITLPKGKIASVGVFVEGVNYSGEVYVEAPFFIGGNHNILPDFAPPVQDKSHFDWTGQYLSHKEWPEFRVILNGEKIFEGEVFERCHLSSEWEVSIPRGILQAENELYIQLISDYHDPLPYTLHEIGLIEQPAGDFSLIAVSEIGTAGEFAYALIRTEKDGVTLQVQTDGKLKIDGNLYFEKAGLHGVKFLCGQPAKNARFQLSDGKKTEKGTISRIVLKENDNVYTGTGDIIYVHQDMESAEEFLSWYLSSGIGNLLTIRPSYLWSGSRTLNKTMWKELARVLNEWDMIYPHMVDGRELPGLNANPDVECIAGNGFVGRQMHERDGAMFYWRRYDKNTSLYAEQFEDMALEICREDPTHSNPIFNGQNQIFVPAKKIKKETDSTIPTFENDEIDAEKRYNYKNPNIEKDMKIAHDYTVQRIREMKMDDVSRHTGPSVTFKYFYEAGFSWVGAETMYGTLEEIMAFKRGAAKANYAESIGVHHALQWSSSPHDAPEHIRRYRLALYGSYMQGATEINTEEGLWRLEEYFSRFHRFSDACIGHTKQQQDFYRYVKSHTRRGKFYTPMALIHGRYDGFNGFARNAFWGFKNVTDTDAEKSWDLLSTFYPEGTLGDPTYCHNCPTDRALGFYASTPMGNVDALPIEAERNVYENYKALAFMGYNCAKNADLARLYEYVKDGGNLLLTLAHLTVTTNYESILNGDLQYAENIFGFTVGLPEICEKTVSGIKVPVAVNIATPAQILARTDDGTPLLVRYDIGRGKVTLLCASAYPAHSAITELYKSQLRLHYGEAIATEPVWVACSQGTQFALYERGDEKDVYFLAVDWYRAPENMRSAKLRIGDDVHTVHFPFGTMIKAVVRGNRCAYPHSEDGEVISVKDGVAKLQGVGRIQFTLINGADSKEILVDFSEKSVVDVQF